MPLVELRDLCKIYNAGDNEVRALGGVSLSIETGEFVAIVGQSGSGKSTLMNMLGCLDLPDGGIYFLDGEDVAHIPEASLAGIRNRRIGFIFQGFNLIPSLTALENVELPALLRGESSVESRNGAKALLEQLGLGKRLDHLPAQLSGGEQQRVALARAFNGRPDVLFADEPTGNLDRQTGDKIADLLFSLNREHGTTLIMVTHDLQLAARCDRCLRLVNGQLQEEA